MTGVKEITQFCFSSNLAGIVVNEIEQKCILLIPIPE